MIASSSCRAGDVGSASTGHRVRSASLPIAAAPTADRPPARITPRRASERHPGRTVRRKRDGRLRRPTGRQRPRSPDERVAERQIEVDRAVGRDVERAAGQRAPRVGERASATPGSKNQRTDRPNRCDWSIVCGAPTSRSSGGRSAVTTSIGTSESPASTTAGWKLAAAVPLVDSRTAGIPPRPRPRATKAADRSSCTTWTASSGRSARASAIGVLREPGATTAARTPRATPLVDEGGAERRLRVTVRLSHVVGRYDPPSVVRSIRQLTPPNSLGT